MDILRMVEGLWKGGTSAPVATLTTVENVVVACVWGRILGLDIPFTSKGAGLPDRSASKGLPARLALRPDTRVYGVIGCPIAHSMSPAIHNAAFAETDYNGVYLPFRVEPDYASFKAFVDFCITRPWLNLHGCSVTIPHKENLLRYVQERGGFIEPLARRIGVANTLCIEPGREADGSDARISAYNTDYRGALDALCVGMGIKPMELKNLSVAVLGAGGVSRAIVAGLRDCGAKVTIYNRTKEKADALAAEFGATALPNEQRIQNTGDAIINCTSIGMWPEVDATPLPKEGLRHRPAVFDTVYNPVETRLLREAKAAGCRTIDGVTMFVNQAVGQFERWTERPAPVQIMRNIVLEQLSKPRQ